MMKRFDIGTQLFHVDTTSFGVYGEHELRKYGGEEEETEPDPFGDIYDDMTDDTIEITYGHAKGQ